MYKTENINIAGRAFIINQDAFARLADYLDQLKKHFSSIDEVEIVDDIESRIAELLINKLDNRQIEVVDINMVESVISTMGTPEDFGIDESNSTQNSKQESIKKKFFRDIDHAAIGGVCGGLANYFNIDVIWIRIVFFLSFLFGGSGFIIYAILWSVIPAARTTAEKLQMKGERANISNIEKRIREEAKRVNDNLNKAAQKVDKNFSQKTRKATQFAGDSLKRLFDLVKGVIGALMIFASLTGIVALSSLLFSPPTDWDINLFDHNWEGGKVFFLVEQVIENQNLAEWFYAGIISLILIPIIAFMINGVNFMFKTRIKFKHWISALFLIFLFGISSVIYTGIHISKQFSFRSESEDKIQLAPSNNYKVNISSISNSNDMINNDPFFNPMKIDFKESSIQYGHSRMQIFPSNSDSSYLIVYKASNGQNKLQADGYRDQIKYQLEIIDNMININPGFETSIKDPYRGQTLDYYLYLKEGSSISLPENGYSLFYDIPNKDNHYDDDMWGKTYTMNNGELKLKSTQK